MATVPLRERKKQFHELITRLLAEMGFKKSGENYIVALTRDSTGIMTAAGVARPGPDGTTLEIFATAAVRYEPLQELLVDLGVRTKCGTSCHNSIHIGYLMPKHTYTPWLFEPDADMTEDALEFVDCVEQYAVPYMRAHASPEALATAILSDTASPMNKFDAPAILYLLGRYDEALAKLEEYLQGADPDTVKYSTVKHVFDDKVVTHRRRSHSDNERYKKYKEFAERLTAKIEEARQAQ